MRTATESGTTTTAITAVLSAPLAAGVVAALWQFPLVIAGTMGHSLGAALSAVLSMALFMTLFSFFGGTLAIVAVGAGAGFLARNYPTSTHRLIGVTVGTVAATVVAVFDAVVAT